MSLLLSPLFLFVMGLAVARLAKSVRVWRRHSLFAWRASGVVLALYTWLLVSLLVDFRWSRGLADRLPGESGTDWVVNSGVLTLDAAWPVADAHVLVFVIVGFMSFPFWMWMGLQSGYWLFGRSPKQTGILGLLR